MTHCTRCGIDTDSTTGMCIDCRDVTEPVEKRLTCHPRNKLDREHRDFEIYNDWLERKPTSHTARRMGISDHTVTRAWNRMGLSTLRAIESKAVSAKIRELHERGLGPSEIAGRVFLSPNSVSERLLAMGIRTRKPRT